jgi:hypothetical protein
MMQPGLEMEGIRFVTDQNGKKIAVQLDLARYGDLWEDFYDQIADRKRRREKRYSLAVVKERLADKVR